MKEEPKLTAIQKRAYQILKEQRPMRGSDLGWELWGETTAVWNRGTGSHRHNKFCRAAGKVLNQLRRLGLADWRGKETYSEWFAR